ncbi:unnamed protein product [Polarella glacialis]|uniref:Uncharacterized protein n=1 Tax=Polarella glacialis TaxID=89957 RepID=A0A813JUS1_POLGL|nr:unnamed protein product [Polarella glacialis]|eukprot:CAMPEP_0115091566 /NCGR_PEP_ID=MMETSP0227-20121206/26191_1 /TAXON_ID=89957 /ORGANISM="Polarella glacialis, Strain CCMP 1383" /LENGTH=105 /DNA_ID=CAMNT_0002483107 /DNA_START=153 /DNA_END=470 /DNA_ORIENTATION=+
MPKRGKYLGASGTQTKPFWALEMIWTMADPTTTKRNTANITGPTVNGALSFLLGPLFGLPYWASFFFSCWADLREVLRDSGIAATERRVASGRRAASTADRFLEP